MKATLIGTDSDRWGFGLRIVSAVLRAAGHSSTLIFLPSEADEYPRDTLEQVSELAASADFVGLSCFSRGSQRARQVASHLRKPGRMIIWGGLHATLNPNDCAEAADAVCRGEGEETVLELAEAIRSGRDWRDIPNLGYKERGKFTLNPLRPPVKNLDELPFFDFSQEDEFHLTRGGGLVKTARDAAGSPKEQALAIGSRGCAFRCTYCCNSQLRKLYEGNGRYIRKLSPARYVSQLESLHNDRFPHATDFFLVDEDFFLRSVAELSEFASLYKERVGIPFECMASPPRVTEEKLKILADAGLWRIRLGVESGSERTKKEIYDRYISNEVVVEASRLIKKQASVVAAYFFIIGNPYEEQADLLDTLQLMSKMAHPYYAQVFNLVFFPGSALYNKAVEDGVITGLHDSGLELHYRSGFQYQQHQWKQKQLYLNTLIFLTEGKTTNFRMGLLPRFLLGLLISPKLVAFSQTRPWISHTLVAFKTGALHVRREAGALLKRVMRDPAAVYDLRLYLRKRTQRLWGSGRRAAA